MSQNEPQQAEPYLLIVEDSPALLRMLTDIMQDEGFTVLGCNTAASALEYFNPERVGVAIVDLRLPDLSDLDLLRKLFDITDQIPVIINTAYSSYETAKEAVNLGAFAYAEKVGDPAELVRHVHRAYQYRYKRRADELEAAVAERTRELQETNQLLQQEITERKRAEADLQKARQDWENIFRAIGHLSLILDSRYTILDANPVAYALAEQAGVQLKGKKCYEIFHQADLAPEGCPLQQILDSGTMETVEVEMEALGRVYLVSCTPILNEEGEIERIIHIATDITERNIARVKMLEYQAQLQILNAELTLAEEHERRRIALDLHDGVAQTLVSLKMSVDALKTIYHDAPLFGKLRQMGDSLKHAVQDIRTLTFDLSSPTLYELGLEPALAEMLTEQFQEPYGIETEFQDDGQPKPLADHLKVTLFRVVRELLMNVVKHAQAQKIMIRCQRENDHIQITVVDNGVGFDPAELADRSGSQGGLGLFSIRERLRHIGGDMRIESQTQQGTKVTLLGPLRQEPVEAE